MVNPAYRRVERAYKQVTSLQSGFQVQGSGLTLKWIDFFLSGISGKS